MRHAGGKVTEMPVKITRPTDPTQEDRDFYAATIDLANRMNECVPEGCNSGIVMVAIAHMFANAAFNSGDTREVLDNQMDDLKEITLYDYDNYGSVMVRNVTIN